MYGKGSGSVIGGATVTGVGAVMLPNTGGNMVGTILAYSAITIGVTAIASQLIVRIIRRKYSVDA
jgi:hypothetical protein